MKKIINMYIVEDIRDGKEWYATIKKRNYDCFGKKITAYFLSQEYQNNFLYGFSGLYETREDLEKVIESRELLNYVYKVRKVKIEITI